jgi:outer membrane protein assembly factor BamA
VVRLLPLLLTLLASAAWAQVRESPTDQFAQRFAAHRVEGFILQRAVVRCDIKMCRFPERKALLDGLLRLELGAPLEAQAVTAAWSRLDRTGYFRQVEVLPRVVPNTDPPQVELVFDAQGAVVITELKISYADWASRFYPRQFSSEIRKRLRLRKGGTFPVRDEDGHYSEADQALLDRQTAQIVKLYTDQGYVGTAARIEAEYYGPQSKQVRITVVVTEGSQPLLGEVLISGNQSKSYAEIASALTTGERAHFWRTFFGAFGIGRYDRRLLKTELRLVEQAYREDGWVSARVRLTGVPAEKRGRVFPRIRVREGPQVEVHFEGNETLSDDDLEAVLTFAENGAWDDTEVEDSKRAIIEAYQTVARYYVRVYPTVERVGRKKVRITFRIVEGRPVYVAEVVLRGNHRISRARLLSLMETRGIAPDGVINALAASSGVVQDALVINDLLAMRDLYRAEGMPGIKFRCAPPKVRVDEWSSRRLERRRYEAELARGVPSSSYGPDLSPTFFAGHFDQWSSDPVADHCFLVEPLDDPRLVRLHIELDEGLRTTTRKLAVASFINQLEPSWQDDAWALFESQGFASGYKRWNHRAGLNTAKLRQVQGFMLRALHRDGYLQAVVKPICPDADGVDGPCDAQRLYGVDVPAVRFDLDRGPQTRVDGILINGNLRTHHHIIRNELLFEDGQPLGTEALFLSQANLRSLGIFDSVRVETLADRELVAKDTVRADATRPAAVLITLEESRYQVIDALLGLQVDSAPLSTGDLPVLYAVGASIRDKNLAGRAWEFGLGANHANRIDTPQDVLGDDATWQTGPFFKDRRFFNTRLNLTTEVTYQQGRTAQRDAYQQKFLAEFILSYDFFNLSYPARWGQGMRATLTTEGRYERLRNLTSLGERPPYSDFSPSLALQPALTWDRRDNPLHPARGWLATLSNEILFSGDSGAFSYREILVGQSVHSFWRKQLIVVPTLRLGAVQTNEPEADLKADFLFKAGGDGVTLPVRGYPDAAIDACNGQRRNAWCARAIPDGDDATDTIPTVGGRAMALASLELRWPTFVIDDFWFAGFADVGGIAADWSSMEADRFYPSVGGGLRWLVTGQIPLRLDIAWPLRKTVFGAQEARIHFNIFYTL